MVVEPKLRNDVPCLQRLHHNVLVAKINEPFAQEAKPRPSLTLGVLDASPMSHPIFGESVVMDIFRQSVLKVRATKPGQAQLFGRSIGADVRNRMRSNLEVYAGMLLHDLLTFAEILQSAKSKKEVKRLTLTLTAMHLSEAKNEYNRKLLADVMEWFKHRDAPFDPYAGDELLFDMGCAAKIKERWLRRLLALCTEKKVVVQAPVWDCIRKSLVVFMDSSVKVACRFALRDHRRRFKKADFPTLHIDFRDRKRLPNS